MQIKGVDGIDNQIINLLLDNARMSYSEIAQIVGLTRTSVKNRIYTLEEKGVISGYRAVVNPQKVPEMMTFIMNIETRPEHFEDAKKKLIEAKQTVTIIETTGNCHLVVICLASNVEEMRCFVNQIYKGIDGISSINAHSVLDVLKGNVISD